MFLFYSPVDIINDSGEQEKVNIFLALYDETGNSKLPVNPLTIENLLRSSQMCKELTYSGYDLKLLKTDQFPNPLYVLGSAIPSGVQAQNIKSVDSVVQQNLNGGTRLSEELHKALVNLLVKNGLSPIIAELMIVCTYAKNDLLNVNQNVYTQRNVEQFYLSCAKQTQRWFDERDRKNTMAAIPDNETKFQQSCTDELFIYLPAYEAMFNYLNAAEDDTTQAQVRDLHTFMPQHADVSDPYGVNASKYEDPDTVQKMIDDGGQTYELLLKEIIGSADNNTEEIHSNEKRYYDALNTWMGVIATEEDGTDEGDICAIAQEYMHTLIETLYIWYWQHNKRVPLAIETGVGDNADESRYTFKSDDHQGNAPEDLIKFLDRVAADTQQRDIYAKAVIQLARWGNRKPTAIVFDGYGKCFDLNTGFVINSRPSLASYNKVKINDCDYKFIGFIKDTTRIADSRIGFSEWPMPIGVILQQEYADKSGNGTVPLNTYFSMIDAIREIVLGKISVDGISYSNGEWQVSEERNDTTIGEVLEASKDPEQLQFPIFRGTGLIQIYSDLHIASPSNTDTQFSIMCSKLQSSKLLDFISSSEFDTYGTFDALTRNGKPGRKQATDYMIVRDLLKVYHAAALNYTDNLDSTGLFKLWHTAILESGYVDEAYFYQGATKPSEPLPGCRVDNFKNLWWRKDTNVSEHTASQPQRINVGEATAQASVVSKSTDVNYRSTIIMQPSKATNYVKFVNESGDVVCICAQEPRRRKKHDGTIVSDPIYIVFDKATVATMDQTAITREFPITRMYAYMCKAFFTLAKESPESSSLRFLNNDAIKELYAYFVQHQ